MIKIPNFREWSKRRIALTGLATGIAISAVGGLSFYFLDRSSYADIPLLEPLEYPISTSEEDRSLAAALDKAALEETALEANPEESTTQLKDEVVQLKEAIDRLIYTIDPASRNNPDAGGGSVDSLPFIEKEYLASTESEANSSAMSTGESSNTTIDPLKLYLSQNESYREKTLDVGIAIRDYNMWSMEHRKGSLQAQLIKDNILFVVVLSVVFYGIFISYIQFQKGGQTEAELKLGSGGIEVKSSVLGILILVFSVGFLYMYLQYVFPIQEIATESLPTAATATQKPPEAQ